MAPDFPLQWIRPAWLFATLFALGGASALAQAQGYSVIPDVTLLDGTGAPAKTHIMLILRGNIIQSVSADSDRFKPPASAKVLHFEGKAVMPGLISAHSHVGQTNGTTTGSAAYTRENVLRQLGIYQRYGVTTVMSLGANKDLLYQIREEQKTGKAPGASVLSAGQGIGVPNGMPGLNVGADQIFRPVTVAQARAAVREMAKHKPDLIKTWVDDGLGKLPRPDFTIEQAVIDEAHKNHLRVAAHVFYLEDAKKLVAAGVDILAHSIRDKPVDTELIGQMKRHGTCYIPTLQLEEAFFVYADHPAWLEGSFFANALQPETRQLLVSPDFAAKIQNDPATALHRQFLQRAEDNLKALSDAGIPIGFGTDSGAMVTRPPGFAEHRELQLMVKAGLTPQQALVAATSGSAKLLHLEDRGEIVPGKRADLLVLDGDPSRQVDSSETIVAVIQGGSVVSRTRLDKAPTGSR